MAGPNYTSVNVTKEQHEKLKRIADFKKAKITDVSVEMAAEYIESFMDKHGEVMAEMEELENRMAQLRMHFKEPKK